MNRQHLYRITLGSVEVYLGWVTAKRIGEIAKAYGAKAVVKKVR